MSTKRNSPFVMEVQPGSYAWCACGESEKQPYCDGSHAKKNTGTGPIRVTLPLVSSAKGGPIAAQSNETSGRVTIEPKKKVAWCCCKVSANKPFCDGTHSKLK